MAQGCQKEFCYTNILYIGIIWGQQKRKVVLSKIVPEDILK